MGISSHNTMEQTLTTGTKKVPFMPMTTQAVNCPPPILAAEFADCRVPGGTEFWSSEGFYSPGVCFVGYQAACSLTSLHKNEWPLRPQETAVRCIPS